jgi:hypothetical protein
MSGSAGVLTAWAVVLLQLGGGTPLTGSIQSIERSVTRPVPQAPPVVVTPRPPVWVPDRYVPVPSGPGTVLLPGHWEQPLAGGQVSVPPLLVCSPAGGCVSIPAQIAPPPESRPVIAPPESRVIPEPRP